MSTETQISANRLNAQKSTGPKTPEGKAKVSQNAVTHGLTAKQPVLDTENPEEYALFCEDFFRHHTPVGTLEQSLVQRAADTFWRLQRAQDYETAVLNTLIQSANTEARSASDGIEIDSNSLLGQVLLDDFQKNHCLEKILKYEMSIERSYYRTLKELRRLQSQRLHNVDEASSLHDNLVNSKNEKNKANPKPPIPTFDPIKLLENCKTNPLNLDPLSKIIMKSSSLPSSAKKVS